MARKAVSELKADVDTVFPDNTSGAITPANHRAFLNDCLDTFNAGYGVLSLGTPGATEAFTTTTTTVTAYDTELLVTEPYTASAATGIVTASVPIVARVTLSASVEFANNRSIVFTIQEDLANVGYAVEADGEGNGNPVTANLTGILDLNAAQTVSIAATMDGGGSTTVTFRSLILIVEAVARRDPPA